MSGSDFVVYPKEFETLLSSNNTTSDIPIDTIEKKDEKPLDLSTNQNLSTVVKNKRKSTPRVNDDRFHRIAKIVLLLAKNDAYNRNCEIKDRNGNFVPGSDLIKFLKFATQKVRRYENMDEFIYQLSLIGEDLSQLIINPVVIREIEISIEKNSTNISKDLTKNKEQEVEGDAREDWIESELNKSDPPISEEKGIKRKRSDVFGTLESPIKSQKTESIPEWDKNPEIEKIMADLISDIQ